MEAQLMKMRLAAPHSWSRLVLWNGRLFADRCVAFVACLAVPCGLIMNALLFGVTKSRQYVAALTQAVPCCFLQVACFCNTVMATQLAASAQLPIGRSQEESEQLLQQTSEALQANIKWVGGPDGHASQASQSAEHVAHCCHSQRSHRLLHGQHNG